MRNNADPDQLTNSKTIFDVSAGEIFWRNLVAGAGRAIGGIIFQIIFFFILFQIFNQFLLPTIQPLLDTLSITTETLQKFQGGDVRVE